MAVRCGFPPCCSPRSQLCCQPSKQRSHVVTNRLSEVEWTERLKPVRRQRNWSRHLCHCPMSQPSRHASARQRPSLLPQSVPRLTSPRIPAHGPRLCPRSRCCHQLWWQQSQHCWAQHQPRLQRDSRTRGGRFPRLGPTCRRCHHSSKQQIPTRCQPPWSHNSPSQLPSRSG